MNRPSLFPVRSLAVPALAAAVALGAARVDEARAQSLWNDATSKSMFADKRAGTVGDILTIIVQENTSSAKENSTKTAKSTGLDAAINTFLYSPAASGFLTKGGKLPAINMSSKNSFDGGGQVQNSEKLTTRIAVRVIDVLPNGSLVLEGRRQTKIAGETTDAVLRGVVRSEDVMANNTVYSYNVADASIQYLSKGPVSDSQRKGWFTKIWDKVTPF
ncbi:MAG: flagellar basal body L-ring protein FlgH [Verrucomicrobiales bacterium]|nr:flagellar basal body L-ring protein FlgH [Verrucomicrobiales bacterium]